jgi:hypothetical protein
MASLFNSGQSTPSKRSSLRPDRARRGWSPTALVDDLVGRGPHILPPAASLSRSSQPCCTRSIHGLRPAESPAPPQASLDLPGHCGGRAAHRAHRPENTASPGSRAAGNHSHPRHGTPETGEGHGARHTRPRRAPRASPNETRGRRPRAARGRRAADPHGDSQDRDPNERGRGSAGDERAHGRSPEPVDRAPLNSADSKNRTGVGPHPSVSSLTILATRTRILGRQCQEVWIPAPRMVSVSITLTRSLV